MKGAGKEGWKKWTVGHMGGRIHGKAKVEWMDKGE